MSPFVLRPVPEVPGSAETAEVAGYPSPSLALVGASVTVPARRDRERGLVSAEWAMAIVAAIAMVGVVVAVVSDGAVKKVLIDVISKIIKSALDLI